MKLAIQKPNANNTNKKPKTNKEKTTTLIMEGNSSLFITKSLFSVLLIIFVKDLIKKTIEITKRT